MHARYWLYGPAMASALLVAAQLRAGEAVVKDTHLKYSGIEYFRGNAPTIRIGGYGEKKTPVTGVNHLDLFDNLPLPKLKIRRATTVDIDTAQSSDHDISANIDVGVVFGASGSGGVRKLKAGDLRLVLLTIDESDIMSAANDSPAALQHLIDFGNDARIVHEIFVVLEARVADAFTSSSSFEVSGSPSAMRITGRNNNQASGATVVTISSGSTFAYSMVKLDWNASSKDKKTKITDVDRDQWGP